MTWTIYKRVNSLIDDGLYSLAFEEMDAAAAQIEEIADHFAVLKARAYERLGDVNAGISVLLSVTRPNFWTYYQLAVLHRLQGNFKEVFKASQNAHNELGWKESRENGYEFTHDYFSSNIEKWRVYFEKEITKNSLKILEIGSWQGGSSLWFLDKIISKRGGELTCIDSFEGSSEHASWITDLPFTIEQIFDKNIISSGHLNLCRKLKGYSQQVLRTLQFEKFDLIYIDGAHEARYVIEDAILSFGMLSDDGFMLFDDYDFTFIDDPIQNTSNAIDFFISTYSKEVEVIDKGRQVLIKKIKN